MNNNEVKLAWHNVYHKYSLSFGSWVGCVIFEHELNSSYSKYTIVFEMATPNNMFVDSEKCNEKNKLID